MAEVFRKELKYVIPVEKYMRMQSLLQAVMEPDKYSVDGSYMVRSQYYDSITDADLHDNLDGVLEKRKIRVRIYSSEATKAKLEYKCKNGTDGIKYSIELTREEAELMESHSYGFLLQRDEELAKKLYVKMTEQVYVPRTIVEYERTAYTYPISDIRVTFDRNIRGSINPYGLFEKEPLYIPLLEQDKGVLEVKYNDFFPSVLKPLLAGLDSVEQSYSKYSSARLKYM
ncbi:MAG: polyphosphate polymerase domain-containing protein [Lachnospira sp.]|nr:polyphosphate polymerase domain-containing protein [Lachnospira sp.]